MPGSCTGSQGRCAGLSPLFPCLLPYATLFLPHTVCCVPSVCPNVVFLSLLHLRRRCFAHSPKKEVVAKSSPRPQAMNLLPLRLERLPLSPLQRSTPVSDLMARIKNTKMPFSIDFGVDDVIVPKQAFRRGAIKNISVGTASAEGKANIHSGGTGGSMWGGDQDAFLESMAEPGNRRWILREMMYFWYYFRLQFEQIFKYRVLGMVLGSVISVFLRKAFTGYSARWVKRSWALRGFLRQAYWGLPLRCAYTERFPLRHPSPKAV